MIELPKELITLISVLVGAGATWLVVAGFKGLGEAFGKDFSKVAKVVAAVVAAGAISTVLGVFNSLLALIPADYIPLTQQVLGLVVMLLSAFGLQRSYKERYGL